MSKTAQQKRQAYQEGLQHGIWRSGHAYSRHPFMAEYRKGYADGLVQARYRDAADAAKQSRNTLAARFLDWLSRRFA